MNDFFRLILSMSLSGSVLILILLAVMPLSNGSFSKGWQYYIWLVVILRLLIPFSPDASLMGRLFDRAETAAALQTAGSVPAAADAGALESKAEHVSQYYSPEERSVFLELEEEARAYTEYIWLPWISGVLLIFACKAFRYRSFINYVKGDSHIEEDGEISVLFRQTSEELGIKRSVPLYRSRLVQSPMLVGLIKPAVVIPENIRVLPGLGYVFRHELIHYKRCDIWYKWLVQLAVCVHWFNPLIYVMGRRINSLCEFSCDEAVAVSLNAAEKKEYCSTIIDVVSFGSACRGSIIPLTFCEEKKNLKERMTAILKYEKKPRGIIALSAALAAALCCAALLLGTASEGSRAALDTPGKLPAEKESMEGIVLIDPGHGGTDLGAVYSDHNEGSNIEINEKEQNLKIALLLRDMLEESGVTAELTRREDKNMTLEERMKKAKDLGASLFVSIHLNAGADRTKRGTMTVYNSRAGQKAAELLHDKLVNRLGTEDAGTTAMSESLKYNTLEMPALTVELAFMTNEPDRKIIMSEDFGQKAAEALHEGILEGLQWKR